MLRRAFSVCVFGLAAADIPKFLQNALIHCGKMDHSDHSMYTVKYILYVTPLLYLNLTHPHGR